MEIEEKEVFIGTQYKTKKACLKNFIVKQELGEGKYATIYEACMNETCPYVLKIMSLKTPVSKDYFKDECKLSKLFGQLKIGPAVYNCWTCDNQGLNLGFIHMDRLDITLGDYAKKYPTKFRLYQNEVKKELVKKIKLMINQGWVHNDLHSENIMLKLNKSDIVDVFIIDFGDVSIAMTRYSDSDIKEEVNNVFDNIKQRK